MTNKRSSPQPKTADGYVRVSRRGGREGESFISPTVQKEKIKGWAELHGVEIVKWWEEIDQSGARRDRPMFQEALGRCEAGETGGIVVARLDRFARSAVDALESIKRMNEVGARLVSVEDNFDGSTPMGRFAIGILTLIAELELERIRESWRTANEEAVGRGVHVSGKTPTGYARDKGGRLVRQEPAASAVVEVFTRRAVGASYRDLADYLDSVGVGPPTGNPNWSTQGVRGLLRNRVYLGEARSGSITNPTAHEALVTQAEFDAVQGSRTVLAPRDGSLAEQALLGGLLVCAGCGHTLKIAGSTNRKTGERTPSYYCRGHYATGRCPAPASVRASTVDPYVEERFLEALAADGGVLAEAHAAQERIGELQRVLEATEHELDVYLGSELMSVIGQERFLEGVRSRQDAVDRARSDLAGVRGQTMIAEDLTDGDLLRSWPLLTTPERRRLLHGFLEKVVVRRAGARGRLAPPIDERAEIVLRGGVTL